ncbi:hypothetical protein ASF48_01155 [Rathayibacter sp. Leaf299]|nr:hypothetical protein ASF48_01155 [Rathayibacter sp. Leaf299]
MGHRDPQARRPVQDLRRHALEGTEEDRGLDLHEMRVRGAQQVEDRRPVALVDRGRQPSGDGIRRHEGPPGAW